MAEIPKPIQLLSLVLIPLTMLAGGIWYFLNHGYDYGPKIPDHFRTTSYEYSAHCAELKRQGDVLKEPIEKEMEPLAQKLIHGDLPLEDGQAIYDKYASLRDQADAISQQYTCK